MSPEAFIASHLRFKGRLAVAATAVSFFVMIVAVAVSGGFRKEIRRAVSELSGDVRLVPPGRTEGSEEIPVRCDEEWLGEVKGMKGVDEVVPVIWRAGIVKNGDEIHGVMLKATPSADSLSMAVEIPSRLSDMLCLKAGDSMTTYFVGEKVKVRKFTVSRIYESIVETDGNIIVHASIEDMRRLNGWDEGEVTALEVRLEDSYRTPLMLKEMTARIGMVSPLVAESSAQRYSNLYDWLGLIDFNVLAILVLMSLVAGFNMISGLLILVFRSTSTIGTLKAVGMTDRSVSKVFLKLASRLLLKGMVMGNAAALLFCLVQGTSHLLKLDPANYFVSFVPVSVDELFVIAADLGAYMTIMLLLLIPCRAISKVDPSLTMGSR